MSDFAQETVDRYGPGGEVIFRQAPSLVRFYSRMLLVPYESDLQGKPVHRAADYIEINTPGERDVIDREATPSDKARHRQEWLAYQEKRETPPPGTLLVALFPHQPEIVDMLASHKCRTVEQLAAVSDTGVQHMGLGVTEWRDRARRFLDVTRDAALFHQVEKTQKDQAFAIQSKDELIDLQKREIADLTAQLEAAAMPRQKRAS